MSIFHVHHERAEEHTPKTARVPHLVEVVRARGPDAERVAIASRLDTLAVENRPVCDVQLGLEEPLVRYRGVRAGHRSHRVVVDVQLVDGALGRQNTTARLEATPLVNVAHREAPRAFRVCIRLPWFRGRRCFARERDGPA